MSPTRGAKAAKGKAAGKGAKPVKARGATKARPAAKGPKPRNPRSTRPKAVAEAETETETETVVDPFDGGAELAVSDYSPERPAGPDRSRQKSKVRELSWAAFDVHAQALARKIRGEFKPDAVVGVVHGGVFVGGVLASALGVDFFPVRISRRSRDRGAGNAGAEMPAELKGKRVLVVDDIASSGDTLELAQTLARKVGAREVKTACLIARENGYAPDWVALPTEDLVVLPWDYQSVIPELSGALEFTSRKPGSAKKPRTAPKR